MDWTNILCVILSAIIGPISIAIVTAALKKQEKKIELRAEEERLHEAKLKEKIYTETKAEITETFLELLSITPLSSTGLVMLKAVSSQALDLTRSPVMTMFVFFP